MSCKLLKRPSSKEEKAAEQLPLHHKNKSESRKHENKGLSSSVLHVRLKRFIVCFLFLLGVSLSVVYIPDDSYATFENLLESDEEAEQKTGSWANCTVVTDTQAKSTTGLIPTSHVNTTSATTKSTTVSCRTIPYRINASKIQPSTQIAIGVLSAASGDGPSRRKAIRETWANTTDFNNQTVHDAISVFFLVAGPWNDSIEQEYNKYGDLVWIDEEEVYDGEKSVLTYKTQSFVRIIYDTVATLNAEKEKDEDEIQMKYIFKTDDDSYIHIHNLYHQLLHANHDLPMDYWGWCQLQKFRPKRDSSAKWPVSYDLYPEPYYPRYCQGAGFALSWKFATCASTQNHISNLRFMPFEDASIGLIAERCGIVPTMIETPRWINLYRTDSQDEKDRVKYGKSKIDKSKLTRPSMLNRIVQHRIYDEWDMKEHHKVVMDPKKYTKESKVKWYKEEEKKKRKVLGGLIDSELLYQIIFFYK